MPDEELVAPFPTAEVTCTLLQKIRWHLVVGIIESEWVHEYAAINTSVYTFDSTCRSPRAICWTLLSMHPFHSASVQDNSSIRILLNSSRNRVSMSVGALSS
ncbi:hypothetical protein PPTG_21502 [Phytophthora nicotianae INRA-310]|uniref:Uncharacterized protein n=1 Tax=Phytophthora nicotianae (strain INRA-310) TaxID=761204 RepID=W2QXT3_PHYN3|nr:hypothetical protein PPTG_21502 [Phytophthora nicotianae INRA-310]ETN18042.1 hypothetical protein PPTG_21502 [Phytophthora nicotianae INRA-310]